MLCDHCKGAIRRSLRARQSRLDDPAKLIRTNTRHHAYESTLLASIAAKCYVCRHFKSVRPGVNGHELLDRAVDPAGHRRAHPPLGDGEPVLFGYRNDELESHTTCMVTVFERVERYIKGETHFYLRFSIIEWKPRLGNDCTVNFDLDVWDDLAESLAYMEHRRADVIPSARIFDPQPLQEESVNEITKATMSLAQRWISKCLESHDACRAERHAQAWVPTRLVHIAYSSEGCLIWRVDETNGRDSEAGPYLTLSHCWGATSCIELTTENHEDLQRWQSIENLPLLYQDALRAAVNIGVPWVWIDSLCIIQRGDAAADWLRESVLMQKVYSSALCNLSAANARDALGRMLLTERDNTALDLETIMAPGTGSKSTETRYCISKSDLWLSEVEQSWVNQRAWVLQERLLSPRILYFGKSQIYWECRWRQASEVFPSFYPERREAGFPVGQLGNTSLSVCGDGTGMVKSVRLPTSWAQDWSRILEKYFQMDLSYQDDRLLAMSALADLMAARNKDRYVAGMWESRLVLDLAFAVRARAGCLNTRTHPSPYVAPSWSWASVPYLKGCNAYMLPALDRPMHILATIDSYGLDYRSRHTALLRGGWLRLWAPMLPLRAASSDDTVETSDRDRGRDCLLLLGETTAIYARRSWGFALDWPPVSEQQDLSLFQRQHQASRFFLMPLVEDVFNSTRNECRALVLELDDSCDGGTYRRIGLLDTLWADPGTWQAVQRVLLAEDHQVPSLGSRPGARFREYLVHMV